MASKEKNGDVKSTDVNLSTLLLLYSLVVDVFFREFPFAAGSACIFELFGLNRALEHWANAQRKKARSGVPNHNQIHTGSGAGCT